MTANATLTVRRLPDFVRGMGPGPIKEMTGTVRRTNAGVLFSAQGRGTFVWDVVGKTLTRADSGTASRYIVEEFQMDDMNVHTPNHNPQSTAAAKLPPLRVEVLKARRAAGADLAPAGDPTSPTVASTAVSEEVDPIVEAAILAAVGTGALKMREIQTATELSDEVLRPALAIMKRAGKLTTTGQTRGTRYSVA